MKWSGELQLASGSLTAQQQHPDCGAGNKERRLRRQLIKLVINSTCPSVISLLQHSFNFIEQGQKCPIPKEYAILHGKLFCYRDFLIFSSILCMSLRYQCPLHPILNRIYCQQSHPLNTFKKVASTAFQNTIYTLLRMMNYSNKSWL